MKRLIAYCNTIFERCMTEDGVNSRLMFFLHGTVSALGTLVLVVAFVFSKDRTGYDLMVLALGGVGGCAAVGRFLTKKNGGASAAPPSEVKQPSPADTSTSGG